MKKISEYKNEDAIDLLADIIEPTAKIFANKELKKAINNKATKIELIKVALKNNKSDLIEILARLNGVDVDEYECTVMSIITDCLSIISDKELSDFFTLQQQMMVEESSESAMESTEEGDA